MLFKNQKSAALKSNRMSLKWAALLLSSMVFVPVAGALLQKSAAASDLETIQSTAESDGQFVRIGLNKSIVVRLPANAQDVIVGNPEIVDAVVRSKNTAYLFARAIGQTNIFFFDEGGRQILNLDLEVAIDAMALQKLIQRSIPGTKITVEWADKNVVLYGHGQRWRRQVGDRYCSKLCRYQQGRYVEARHCERHQDCRRRPGNAESSHC